MLEPLRNATQGYQRQEGKGKAAPHPEQIPRSAIQMSNRGVRNGSHENGNLALRSLAINSKPL